MMVKVGNVKGTYAIQLDGRWYGVWYGKLSKIGYKCLEMAVAYIDECDRQIVQLMS